MATVNRVKHTSSGLIQPARRIQIFDLDNTNGDVTFEIDWPAYHSITQVYGRCIQDITASGDIDFKLGTTEGGDEVVALGGVSAPNILDNSDSGTTVAGKAYSYPTAITLDGRGATSGDGVLSTQKRVLYGTIPQIAGAKGVTTTGAFEITVEFRQWQ